jgi:hypothetical protein
VIHDASNFRDAASTSGAILEVQSAGTQLSFSGASKNQDGYCWMQMTSPSQRDGWIAQQLVNCEATGQLPPPTRDFGPNCPADNDDLQRFVQDLKSKVCGNESQCALAAEILDNSNSSILFAGYDNADLNLEAWSTVKFPMAMIAHKKVYDEGWDQSRWNLVDPSCRNSRNVPVPGLTIPIHPTTYEAAARGALEWSENQLSSCMMFPLLDGSQAHAEFGSYSQALDRVRAEFADIPGVQVNRWRIYPFIHVAGHCQAAANCDASGNSFSAKGAVGIMKKFHAWRHLPSMQSLEKITSLETIGLAAVKNKFPVQFYGKLGHGKAIWSAEDHGVFNHFGQFRSSNKNSALSVAYLHGPVGTHGKAKIVGECLVQWWLAR